MDGVDQGPQAGPHLAHRRQRTQLAGGLRDRPIFESSISQNSDQRYSEEHDGDTGRVG